ncbi:hypothetical protein [Thiohalorhabdus methylotrophus]|uniref:Uncharacterized protein n=1 Tax=Thiohalorhabdus methylotrophus TaxID=3242694 RepID=A0ABV4TT13_9GAMM
MARDIQWQGEAAMDLLSDALDNGDEVVVWFEGEPVQDLVAMAQHLDPLNEKPDLKRPALYPVQAVLGAGKHQHIKPLAQLHDKADGNGYLVDLDPDAGSMRFHKGV